MRSMSQAGEVSRSDVRGDTVRLYGWIDVDPLQCIDYPPHRPCLRFAPDLLGSDNLAIASTTISSQSFPTRLRNLAPTRFEFSPSDPRLSTTPLYSSPPPRCSPGGPAEPSTQPSHRYGVGQREILLRHHCEPVRVFLTLTDLLTFY